MPKRKLTESERELIKDIVQPYYNMSENFPYESELREGYDETVGEFADKLKQLLYDVEDCKIGKVILGIPDTTSQKGFIDNFLTNKQVYEIEQRIDEPLAKLFRLVADKATKCKTE